MASEAHAADKVVLYGAIGLVILFMLLLLISALANPMQAAPNAQAAAARSCSVTLPNGSTPPGEHPDPQWDGNGKVWAMLYWPNGTLVFRPGGPGFVLPDGSLAMKVGWWRRVGGKLTITGSRVDAAAPPLRADVGLPWCSDVHIVSTYVIFPTTGCWKVVGRVDDSRLVFVTRVVKVRNGPFQCASHGGPGVCQQ